MTSLATASRSRTFFGGVACVALAALVVALGAGQIRGREASAGPEFSLEVPDAATIAPEATEDDIPMPLPAEGSSDMADNAVVPAPTEAQPDAGTTAQTAAPDQTAVAASEPAPHFNARTEPAKPPRSVALARPIVLAAGRFSIAGRVLELDGIVPVAVNRQCTDTSGEGWPCGRMARTAFANLVRGRTIDCDVPSVEWTGTAKARCTLAGKDLSDWLVENGWAEPEAGSPLMASADAARRAGVGLYSPDPRRSRATTTGNAGQRQP